MYATKKNISDSKPQINENSICGKYLFYPDRTGKRLLERGLRLKNSFKKNIPNKPLVTVITTVLNSVKYIEKSICSVFSQTYSNIELIIIDANSTDGTLSKINKYIDCIDYLISEPDNSLYEGMNKGISLASGEYIIILNSDDWYEKNCLEILVSTVLEKRVNVASALSTEVDRYGNILRHIPFMPFDENIRMRMPLRHETMLISKSVYNLIGYYDSSYKIIADLKYTQKIFEKKIPFYQINNYLMNFRKIGIASTLSPELISERKRLLREQFPFLNSFELEVLSNEYKNNISNFRNIVSKYKNNEKLVNGVKCFLNLNGVLSAL
jgi:glycosyltransferase involved in cell wall biosynthesis